MGSRVYATKTGIVDTFTGVARPWTDRERLYLNALGEATGHGLSHALGDFGGFLENIGLGDVGPLALEGAAAAAKGFTGATIAAGALDASESIAALIPEEETSMAWWDDIWNVGENLVEDAGVDLGDLGGIGDIDLGGIGEAVGDVGQVVSGINDIFGGDDSGGGGRQVVTRGGGMQDGGDDYGGGMIQTGGAAAVAGAAALWLGSYLARTMGRGAAGAIFTAANGLKVRLSQLWPLVNRYGWQAVAGALGIGAGSLGTLLMNAPRHGHRRRSRGVTGAQLKNATRTMKTIKRMYRMLPTRPSSSGRGGARRYYPRRRYGSY